MFEDGPYYCELTSLYSYYTGPIDHWDGWVPAADFIKRLVGLELAGESGIAVYDFLTRLLASAYTVAQSRGFWEGDVRNDEGFHVAYLGGKPPRTLDELYVGWKQDNNGSTYFVGPKLLNILESAEYYCHAPTL